MARTLASWHTYAASVDGDELALLQYAAGEVRASLDAGGELAVRVESRYPDDGAVRVEVLDAPEREVSLRLRVPAWAHGATLVAPGRDARPVAPGWAEVRGALRPGDASCSTSRRTRA
ncbi:beta-L-arabinofuranosidase domain-containing protein [Cellulosimicrobium sp. CUA-896]|uniref:beta-L-arabinofuranosidase domain-containing protein n=1 Tax=Cellulosimicrobium sp. CUA-896 TaxID=1517881 RepID=UPI002100C61C|nr:beta-L-arabinofuranosidase domain-containing protein [Cellulosimicrobium sp. CUA-896]